MPIYAYRCDACHAPHEALQKLSDAPLITCPACGAEALVKQVTAAGFQLKGSGWYVTDFRGGSQGKDAAKPAGAAATADTPAAPAGTPAPATASATTAAASPAPAPAPTADSTSAGL